MINPVLIRSLFMMTGIAGILADIVIAQWWRVQVRLDRMMLSGVALTCSLVALYLWANHIDFPLNLDLMEGVILQHVQRAVAGEAIYPQPTPEYVPLAYNPLYYVISVPFTWILGTNLITLRFVAILGAVGSGAVIYLVTRENTGSVWWGTTALGLYSAAYWAMDAYLDTAHSDSWMLFTALLGTYLVQANRSRQWKLAGIVLLVSSFWFKQHGALFAVAGILFLTWRDGPRRSWPYWIAASILGPGLYIFGGPRLFGSHFHYFTWEVPSRWSELNLMTVQRYVGFVQRFYPLLALSAGLLIIRIWIRDRENLNTWHIQGLAAVLTGLMGSLDPGSSNNVYIPMGAWLILLGVMGLHHLASHVEPARRYRVHIIGLIIAFASLLYNVPAMIVSPRAQETYVDFVDTLSGLQATVYAPSLGQLPSGYVFYPAAHWVALEDMIRGPGRDMRNHPKVRALLEPAIRPVGEAYILTNHPLESRRWDSFLEEYYVLNKDFEDRFEPLRVLPGRFGHGWPRYLYRYAPDEHASKTPLVRLMRSVGKPTPAPPAGRASTKARQR